MVENALASIVMRDVFTAIGAYCFALDGFGWWVIMGASFWFYIITGLMVAILLKDK